MEIWKKMWVGDFFLNTVYVFYRIASFVDDSVLSESDISTANILSFYTRLWVLVLHTASKFAYALCFYSATMAIQQ